MFALVSVTPSLSNFLQTSFLEIILSSALLISRRHHKLHEITIAINGGNDLSEICISIRMMSC